MEECEEKLPKRVVDVTKLYRTSTTRLLGGGKSGAYVFLVKGKRRNTILKYYPYSIGGAGGEYIGSRPLRDVLTSCALSGVTGFPELLRVFKTIPPVEWMVSAGVQEQDMRSLPAAGLATLSSVAPGTPLSDMEPEDLPPRVAIAIGFRLLKVLSDAEKRLGSFTHYDLHPGNIMIDKSKTVTTRIRGHTLVSPVLTLIDFDLAVTNFEGAAALIDAARTPNDRYAYFQKHLFVPLATLSFLYKMSNRSILFSGEVLMYALNFTHPDMQNWFVMMTALLGTESSLAMCHNPEHCIDANLSLLEEVAEKKKNAPRKRRVN
tara:strand:+ start:7852 stop:8808 length:957 start_codon:yes stop_codon:yes gene_type:complete